MKARIICITLALVLAALGFTACGKADTAGEDTTSAVSIAEEDGQNPVMNFVGPYQSDRRSMMVEALGTDEAKITASWGIDAWTTARWVMSGKVTESADGLELRYTNGTFATIETDEDGNETQSNESDGGTGVVQFKNDGTIVWTDDQDELIKNLVFEFVPTFSDEEEQGSYLYGTWTDGDDLQYVFNADGSGSVTHIKEDIGVSFQFEADMADGTILFHEGSADDNTPATFAISDGSLTLTYEDGRTVVLSRIADSE